MERALSSCILRIHTPLLLWKQGKISRNREWKFASLDLKSNFCARFVIWESSEALSGVLSRHVLLITDFGVSTLSALNQKMCFL